MRSFWRAGLCLLLLACGSAAPSAADGDVAAPPDAPTVPAKPAGDPAPPSATTDPGAVNPPAPPPPPPADVIDTAALDALFQAQMPLAHASAASIALVKGGRVRFTRAFGVTDVTTLKPATPDTLFMLASVSKPVMAAALMHLIEDPAKGLSLDRPIDEKLPFRVRNPHHSSTPITYRMLLTHTSSLVDGNGFDDDAVGDSTDPLGDWLRRYVQRSDSWSYATPGNEWSYSNSGAALAGYLVEQISGMDLQTYCQSVLFAPLQMKETSWFLKGLDPTHIAMPYELDSSSGALVPQGFYGFTDYPDGQLRTSAAQLGRFLTMIARGGELDGARVLQEVTVQTMKQVQLPDVDATQGLILYYDETFGTKLLGHNGAYKGVSTDMWLDTTTGAGFVLLTNSGAYYDGADADLAAMTAMDKKLLELAEALP